MEYKHLLIIMYLYVFIYLQGNYFHDTYNSPPSPVTRHLMQRHPDAVVVQATSGKNPQVSFWLVKITTLDLSIPKTRPRLFNYKDTRKCIFYPRYNKHYSTTNSTTNSFTFLLDLSSPKMRPQTVQL